MTVDRPEPVEEGSPIDPEATVAKSVRILRESRGISQKELGSGLLLYGFGMHQTTVAKLEAGTKSLRLNEIAAIAAYFDVPLESLWQDDETLNRVLNQRLCEAAANAEQIAAEAEQAVSDYYTQQRIERLRNKC